MHHIFQSIEHTSMSIFKNRSHQSFFAISDYYLELSGQLYCELNDWEFNANVRWLYVTQTHKQTSCYQMTIMGKDAIIFQVSFHITHFWTTRKTASIWPIKKLVSNQRLFNLINKIKCITSRNKKYLTIWIFWF